MAQVLCSGRVELTVCGFHAGERRMAEMLCYARGQNSRGMSWDGETLTSRWPDWPKNDEGLNDSPNSKVLITSILP